MNIFGFCALSGFASLKLKWSIHSYYAIFIICFCVFPSSCDAQFLVDVVQKTIGGWRLIHRCEAKGASFGLDIPTFSYRGNGTGCVAFTEPSNACGDVAKASLNITGCKDIYAFVRRGDCQFSEKAYHVQLALYRALIMFSNEGEQPIPMDGEIFKERVHIPVVMVSYGCMMKIKEAYPPENGYRVAIRAIPGYYDLVKYLIPFVGVVGLCFIVLFLSLLFRVCRERRRIARKRLSKSNLKKLPTRKYKKGEGLETCAICLDDFVEGEKLRILPCNHVYHCKCIDPWLTKNRKVCPICKRKVCSTGDSDSSDSDNERRNTATAEARGSTTHENAPLIDNEMQLASAVLGNATYLDDRGGYVFTAADVEQGQGGGSLDAPTTSATAYSNNRGVSRSDESPYLETVIPPEGTDMHRSASGVSGILRQKFRPIVQGLVNKATRTLRKDQKLLGDVSQLDASESGVENFCAENEAFDENVDGQYVRQALPAAHTDTGSVHTSSTMLDAETNDESVYFSANDQSLPLELKTSDEASSTDMLSACASETDFTARTSNATLTNLSPQVNEEKIEPSEELGLSQADSVVNRVGSTVVVSLDETADAASSSENRVG